MSLIPVGIGSKTIRDETYRNKRADAPSYVLACHPALLKALSNVPFRYRDPLLADLERDARLAVLLALDVFHR